MLPMYLKTLSSTKFILIQDNVKQKATDFLVYLITSNLKYNSNVKIVYAEFDFNRAIRESGFMGSVEKHDFIGRLSEDDSGTVKDGEAERLLDLCKNECILVIDSLAHAVYKFGAKRMYQILYKLKRTTNIKQIITVLHTDLFEEDDDVFKFMEQLSTIHITLKPKFMSQSLRVSYLYKKPGGKIISEIEQYSFENGELVTKPVEKIDPKIIVQESLVAPEDLTTFKITLDDDDKESRGQFVLPYLPKEETTEKKDGGNIFYEFDEVDDWDEEDPDDDLDI